MLLSARKSAIRWYVEQLESRDVPTTITQNFDGVSSGLPSGWSQWASDSTTPFGATAVTGTPSSPNALSDSSISTTSARTWATTSLAADITVSADVYVHNPNAAAQVFARGSNLSGSTPTYYAATIIRATGGPQLDVAKVVSGSLTNLTTAVTSSTYLSGVWMVVALDVEGSTVRASLQRLSDNEYLTSAGTWQTAQTWAVSATDTSITGSGYTGVAEQSGSGSSDRYFDNFSATEVNPSTYSQNFDSTTTGTLPSGWSQWASDGSSPTTVAAAGAVTYGTAYAYSNPNALTYQPATSAIAGRGWYATTAAADGTASIDDYLNISSPAYLFNRGSNLGGTTPTFYAATISSGYVTLGLEKDVAGTVTSLGSVSSTSYLTNAWAQVTLDVEGSTVRAQVERLDTAQYLTSSGTWQSTPTWAVSTTDTSIAAAGYAGVGRDAGTRNPESFDNFAIAMPGGGGGGTLTPPTVPQHYPWIRIADLAYRGNPDINENTNTVSGATKTQLDNSVDLVVANDHYFPAIHQEAANTPLMVYTNVSNLYDDLLTSWLQYADGQGVSREYAFYHASNAYSFSGSSPSSRPVTWFWGVSQGSTDLTDQARGSGGSVAFGGAGTAVNVGYLEKFREINLNLSQYAGGGWAGQWEYASAVDINGNPTTWKSLPLLADGTSGLHQNGTIAFDPPTDWVTASINATLSGGTAARLYYVRLRTTIGGTAPVATPILGRDYVGANGGTSGTIPVFDDNADTNHDGYLSDAEYANRAAGKDARFKYEGRVFYPNYGQMRFLSSSSHSEYQSWIRDYLVNNLTTLYPQASGYFVDNCSPPSGVIASSLVEPYTSSGYMTDLGNALHQVALRLQQNNHWLLANTYLLWNYQDVSSVSPVASQVQAVYQEFDLRPFGQGWNKFEAMAGSIAGLDGLTSNPLDVIDSYDGGDPIIPSDHNAPRSDRFQLAALAGYYVVATSQTRDFLNFDGGNAPATSWQAHWSDAVKFNVGTPTGAYFTKDSGNDPNPVTYQGQNYTATYKVYARNYSNALVLYKPLSFVQSIYQYGSTSDATATTLSLGGSYYLLGTNGQPGTNSINNISLHNGEGAILIPVGGGMAPLRVNVSAPPPTQALAVGGEPRLAPRSVRQVSSHRPGTAHPASRFSADTDPDGAPWRVWLGAPTTAPADVGRYPVTDKRRHEPIFPSLSETPEYLLSAERARAGQPVSRATAAGRPNPALSVGSDLSDESIDNLWAGIRVDTGTTGD